MASFDQITADLERQAIELPSWAFGNSGTRFKVFAQPGVPRDPFEKVADAAQVHLHTGLAPSVALHIPWDRVDDFDKLAPPRRGPRRPPRHDQHEHVPGRRLHARQPVPRRRAGPGQGRSPTRSSASTSWTSPAAATSRSGCPTASTTRARPTSATARTGSPTRCAQVYARLGDHQRLVLEYKLFEPAFYATDVPDWGTAYVHCVALGERAVVCLDTGHHAPGTNIEFIVMQLLRLGRLGAFDFNSRFYADDDLIVGAADPFQLFRILFEVVRGGGYDADSGVSFMLDQCHNIEAKIPGQIRSVLNVQEMTARALLVDRDALAEAERAGDVLAGNAVLMDAFYTDVRADLADWRAARGLPGRPDGGVRRAAGTPSGSSPSGSAATRPGGAREPGRRASCSTARTGSAPTRATRTTPAATPRPRAPTSTRPPATDVELLWVKGSGGDLGTLTEAGLAVLRLDRLRALVDVYPGEEREDEMVAAFDFCLHGRGGAAPSIDTAMHGLVDRRPRRPPPPRQRHRHRHRGRRRAAHQGHLRRQGRLGAVAPARVPARPRHRRRPATANPQAVGVHPRRPRHHRLGRHQRRGRGQPPLDHRDRRRPTSTRTATRRRSAPSSTTAGRCPPAERRAKAAALAPHLRAIASRDHRMVGHFTDSDVVLDFLAGEKLDALAELGTSCPDHFLRTKVKPLVLDLPRRRRSRSASPAWPSSTSSTGPTTPPTTSATPTPDSPADARRRPGDHPRARRRHVLLRQGQADRPGRRRVLRQRHQRHARRRGAVDLRPDPRVGEVPHRVLGPRGGEAPAPARSRSATPVASRSSPARPAASARPSPPGSPPTARASSSPTSTPTRRAPRPPSSAAPTSPSASPVDVTDAAAVRAAVDATLLAFGGIDLVVNNAGLSISKPLLETTEAGLGPPARRDGQGQLPRRPGRGQGDDRPAPRRRHRLHRLEERAVRRARTTSPTARPRPTRPTRSGCSPPSSASTASASTASTPTASSGAAASSPAAGARSAPRSTACPRRSSARSTRSARCSSARCSPSTSPTPSPPSCSDEFSHTTGLLVPVDAGVAAAFLR